jgi:hypothetical protein
MTDTLSTEAAARRARVADRTIRHWLRTGLVEHERDPQGRRLVVRASLDAHLAAKGIIPDDDPAPPDAPPADPATVPGLPELVAELALLRQGERPSSNGATATCRRSGGGEAAGEAAGGGAAGIAGAKAGRSGKRSGTAGWAVGARGALVEGGSMNDRPTHRLLIDESPFQFQPSLAATLGLNEAIFIQQTHYWLQRTKHERDGRWWVYNTMEAWQRIFPLVVGRHDQAYRRQAGGRRPAHLRPGLQRALDRSHEVVHHRLRAPGADRRGQGICRIRLIHRRKMRRCNGKSSAPDQNDPLERITLIR